MTTPRENQVEKLFLSTINRLLKPQGYELMLGRFSPGSNTIPIFLSNSNSIKGIGALWPEWSDVYIVCIGENRGQYITWRLSSRGVEISLNTETTDPKDFGQEEKLAHSPLFIQLSKLICRQTRLPNDYSGSLDQKDGLPEGTTILYRFASTKPIITTGGKGLQIDFRNATVIIPLEGEPTLDTYDIFECVITHNGKKYHLEG